MMRVNMGGGEYIYINPEKVICVQDAEEGGCVITMQDGSIIKARRHAYEVADEIGRALK